MWYSAEVLFMCEDKEDKVEEILYEKSILLITVENGQDAHRKAEQKAKLLEVNYKNLENNDVKWKLIKILDVQEIYEDELYDGVEVFSRLQWGTENNLVLE